jgi:hypothetical protein
MSLSLITLSYRKDFAMETMETYNPVQSAWDYLDEAENCLQNMQKLLQEKRYEDALIPIFHGIQWVGQAEFGLRNSEKTPEGLASAIDTYNKTLHRKLCNTKKIVDDPTLIRYACKRLRNALRGAPADSHWEFKLVTPLGDTKNGKNATLYGTFVFGNSKVLPEELRCKLHYTSQGVRIDSVSVINGTLDWHLRWILGMPEMVEKVEKMVLKQLKHELATESAFPTKLGDF